MNSSQKPRSKLRGIKLAAQQSCGVFDPRGSRQMDMQACPLGSLLAGIKNQPLAKHGNFHSLDLFLPYSGNKKIVHCYSPKNNLPYTGEPRGLYVFLYQSPHTVTSDFTSPEFCEESKQNFKIITWVLRCLLEQQF